MGTCWGLVIAPAAACVLSAYVAGIQSWRIYTSYYGISYVCCKIKNYKPLPFHRTSGNDSSGLSFQWVVGSRSNPVYVGRIG